MVDTKSLEQTRRNWEASHGRIPDSYKQGINNTKEWQSKAIQGEGNYAAGVNEAVANQSRAKALASVSDEAWKRAAGEKGSQRIAPGMAASKEKFASGMSAVLSTLQSVQLPARTTSGVQNVQNRVIPIVQALENMRK